MIVDTISQTLCSLIRDSRSEYGRLRDKAVLKLVFVFFHIYVLLLKIASALRVQVDNSYILLKVN